jgi:glucuronate isomerase
MPIFDYHCHIPPQDIANDRQYTNLTQIWLAGDHYKWRAMRTNGVPEKYCTGNASDWEKFEKWAETVPKPSGTRSITGPTLSLSRFFGIDNCSVRLPPGKSGTNAMPNSIHPHTRSGISSVWPMSIPFVPPMIRSIPGASQTYQEEWFEVNVLPAWRPDRAMMVEDPVLFNSYVDQLGVRFQRWKSGHSMILWRHWKTASVFP